MPLWTYHLPPLLLALLLVILVEAIALGGLHLFRRLMRHRIRYNDGINDAISGVVAAVGVFYGITVGLLAIGVWNAWEGAAALVSKEAAAIAAVYHDAGSYPAKERERLQSGMRAYAKAVVGEVWPAQQTGRVSFTGHRILDDVGVVLQTFEPATPGQTTLHAQTLQSYDKLRELQRLRNDAVDSGLPRVMWVVIWIGAAISVSVTYFYDIEDAKLHGMLVALMSAFLALTIFTIGENDKPFYGRFSIPHDSYTLIQQRLLEPTR